MIGIIYGTALLVWISVEGAVSQPQDEVLCDWECVENDRIVGRPSGQLMLSGDLTYGDLQLRVTDAELGTFSVTTDVKGHEDARCLEFANGSQGRLTIEIREGRLLPFAVLRVFEPHLYCGFSIAPETEI